MEGQPSTAPEASAGMPPQTAFPRPRLDLHAQCTPRRFDHSDSCKIFPPFGTRQASLLPCAMFDIHSLPQSVLCTSRPRCF